MASKLNQKFQIEPLENRVFVKVVKQEKMTQGGILLPESTDPSDFVLAEVLTISKSLKGVNIKVGDMVFVDKYSSSKLVNDGQEYLLVNIEHIAGISLIN